MSQDAHSLIVNYLLGLMSETELERFERGYLTNESLFNELQEVEDELIDDYASGALNPEQRASFEKYFLRSSERREKLAFATAMTERAVVWQKATLVSVERPSLEPTSKKLPDKSSSSFRLMFLKGSVPAWRQWAALAAVVLLAIAIGVLWLRNRDLRRQLIIADANNARLRQEADAQSKITADTKAELSAERQQSEILESKVDQLQKPPEDGTLDTILSVVLRINELVGATRGGEKKVKTLNIPENAQLVKLTLEVPGISFESFNILLRRDDEGVVWRRSALRVRQVGDRRLLNLSIPAQNVTPDNYELLLIGVPPQGETELVGRYYLKVQRKRATK